MDIISKTEARRIILDAQALTKLQPFGAGPASVTKAIQHLSYVQIDTISVVERAHHHVLWTHIPAYQPDWLEKAQYKTRSVFEYWSHAAAYLPMEDYRFALPIMDSFRKKKDNWPHSNTKDIAEIMARIRTDGPVMSRDFESDHRGGTWWDWKLSKWALQRLFLEGHLMVSHREGFQRVYDLAENILPAGINTTQPTEREYYAWIIKRTLTAQGVASRNAMFHLRKIDQKQFDKVLHELVENGDVIPVKVESHSLYTTPSTLERKVRLQSHVIILSPFDNLVIWRQRLKAIFDFDYTLECYIPAHKRQYGYFCLPVLYRDNFIGRADVKADRKKRELKVQKMHWEEGIDKKELKPLLKDALVKFALFNSCKLSVG
jgi:uncharacterized protein YcaQ